MTKSKNHTDIEDFYNSTGKLLTNVLFDDVHGCKQSVKTVMTLKSLTEKLTYSLHFS